LPHPEALIRLFPGTDLVNFEGNRRDIGWALWSEPTPGSVTAEVRAALRE